MLPPLCHGVNYTAAFGEKRVGKKNKTKKNILSIVNVGSYWFLMMLHNFIILFYYKPIQMGICRNLHKPTFKKGFKSIISSC